MAAASISGREHLTGFRVNGNQDTWIELAGWGENLRVTHRKDEGYLVSGQSASPDVRQLQLSKDRVSGKINGKAVSAKIVPEGDSTHFFSDGTWLFFDRLSRDKARSHTRNRRAATESGKVASPMHGVVCTIEVSVGDNVNADQVLLSIEAMKLEISVAAGVDGEVVEMGCVVGEQVEEGQTLVRIKPCTG